MTRNKEHYKKNAARQLSFELNGHFNFIATRKLEPPCTCATTSQESAAQKLLLVTLKLGIIHRVS